MCLSERFKSTIVHYAYKKELTKNKKDNDKMFQNDDVNEEVFYILFDRK